MNKTDVKNQSCPPIRNNGAFSKAHQSLRRQRELHNQPRRKTMFCFTSVNKTEDGNESTYHTVARTKNISSFTITSRPGKTQKCLFIQRDVNQGQIFVFFFLTVRSNPVRTFRIRHRGSDNLPNDGLAASCFFSLTFQRGSEKPAAVLKHSQTPPRSGANSGGSIIPPVSEVLRPFLFI